MRKEKIIFQDLTVFIEYETVLDKHSNEPSGLTEIGK
jgi:hypothetical protein